MLLAKTESCPPLLGRTESSNDGARGSSLNATIDVRSLAFFIFVLMPARSAAED